jgi:hypothetical protein
MMSLNRAARWRWIALLPLLGMGLFAAPLQAEAPWTPQRLPRLAITRAGGDIKLDGHLDDAGWRNAARATSFVEHEPGDQTRPPVATVALVTYDDSRLYVAFVCEDDPRQVRASFCERDRIWDDDNVGILLDSYGDAAWAYELMINPYGIQSDLLYSPEGGEDEGYNMIWESAGRITDSGYQVEIAIPFASLRFPAAPQQSWRMDFWRNHPREVRRQYSWAQYDRDEPCWPCQWGTVEGMENIAPGRGIELLPSAIGYQSGLRNDVTGRVDNADPDGEFSLNGKYAISSGVTVEATVNPDFSQIESDAAQIDVNSAFALDYPERRPFFQEGSDLFLTPFRTVYTRMINDPRAAAKLVGRLNRLSIGYLAAYDEHSPIIVPFEEFSRSVPSRLSPRSFSNILRARRAIGTDSYVGMVATDRHLDGGGYSALAGIDTEIRFLKNYQFRLHAVGTSTEEPDDSAMTASFGDILFDNGRHTAAFDGESFTGHAFHARVERSGRHFSSEIYYSERSPTFRADNGFEPTNDQRKAEAAFVYEFFPTHGPLTHWYPEVSFYRQWNFDGRRKAENVEVECGSTLKWAQIQLVVAGAYGSERYRDLWFDNMWNVGFACETRPSDLLAFGTEITYGDQIARGARVLGRELALEPALDLKPSDRLLIENSFQYARSINPDTDERLYREAVARTRLTYQFTRRLSGRVVVQYVDSRDWTDPSAERHWQVDPLVTYRVNSFSMVYAGSTHNYDDLAADDGDSDTTDWSLASRQFFLKVQYLFQL